MNRHVVVLALLLAAQVSWGQAQAPNAVEAHCMEGLRAWASGDHQGAVGQMVTANAADVNRANPWPEFWMAVIAAQPPTGLEPDFAVVAGGIESAAEREGALLGELAVLWGIDSRQRALYAYLLRDRYCDPSSAGMTPAMLPGPGVPEPMVLETPDDIELEVIAVHLSQDWYVNLLCDGSCDIYYEGNRREWDGYVYDSRTHAVVTAGGTQRYSQNRCTSSFINCRVGDQSTLNLENGYVAAIRLIGRVDKSDGSAGSAGVWHGNVASGP